MYVKKSFTALCLVTIVSCAGLKFEEQKATIPVGQVSPEIDYSNETPDCTTAGERIAANIQEGMALEDVIRLVGKPGWKIPGAWWWTESFDNTGKPFIRFEFGANRLDAPVNSFSADTTDC